MKLDFARTRRISAAALVSAGMFAGSMGVGAAAPSDYIDLLVNPNVVTDSNAWLLGPPTLNPEGSPGASAVYTHRDSTRTITDTVWVLGDPAAATAAITKAQGANPVANAKTQPAAVGTGGQLITGTSADGSKSLSILYFTQGNAASSIEFSGPANDPVPADLVVDFGQAQDTAIKNNMGG
jgi:hypothetical protein